MTVRTKTCGTRRQTSVSLMFLPDFDIFYDLLLNRRTAYMELNLFSMQNEGNSSAAMHSTELRLFHGNQAMLCQIWIERCFSFSRKFTAEAKPTIFLQNAGKVKSVFVIRQNPCGPIKLDDALNNTRVEKVSQKTSGRSQHQQVGGHPSRSLKKGAMMKYFHARFVKILKIQNYKILTTLIERQQEQL